MPGPCLSDMTINADVRFVVVSPILWMDLDLRVVLALTLHLAVGWMYAQAQQSVAIEAADPEAASNLKLISFNECDQCYPPEPGSYVDDGFDWLSDVKVGYDRGFVIAATRERKLKTSNHPFVIRLNGWGQLRHTISDLRNPGRDLNEFQLKRGRLIFSGQAFNPNFSFFLQLDGRSSNGDDVRLLDYYFDFDVGHDQLGLKKGTLGIRAGKYKMPFTMSRWLSGKEFEFTDRSVASTFFDVNRSFAWGVFGTTKRLRIPIVWEAAIFNGLVTGGAETGSSGSLDDNFAYSARVLAFPCGQWGDGSLTDFEGHKYLAMRIGCGYAASEIDEDGTTEFSRLLVVDSGERLENILPGTVSSYEGWSLGSRRFVQTSRMVIYRRILLPKCEQYPRSRCARSIRSWILVATGIFLQVKPNATPDAMVSRCWKFWNPWWH